MLLALSLFARLAQADSLPPPPVVNGDTTSDFEAVGALLVCDSRGYCGEFCSATLIASKWVLTAAHCVVAFDDYARSGYTGYFGVGRNVSSLTAYAEFKNWHEHPDYNDRDLQNDIGIVELKTAISSVDPVPLNEDAVTRSWVGDELTYVGWGITTDTGSDSGTKRYALMPIYDYDSQFIYSYDGDDSQNLCSGDSGGAALETVTGGYELAGVNSFVFSVDSSSTSCIGGGAGVTRVDQHIDWIEGYTGDLSASSSGGGSSGGGTTGGGSSGGGSSGGGGTGGGTDTADPTTDTGGSGSGTEAGGTDEVGGFGQTEASPLEAPEGKGGCDGTGGLVSLAGALAGLGALSRRRR